MKRKFLLLTIISVLCCQLAKAQSLKLIPKVGVNLATYSFSDEMLKALSGSPSINSVTLFSFGIGLDAKIANNFSLQPEFNYNQTGYNLEATQGSVKAKADYKFNTLQIPLLLKYSFGESENVRFSLLAGPYYSHNLGGTYRVENSSGSQSVSIAGDMIWGTRPANYSGTDEYISKDEASRGDFGAILGFAGSFKLGAGELYLEARYTYGFTNFFKDATNSQGSATSDMGSASRVIGFQVGYAIPLNK